MSEQDLVSLLFYAFLGALGVAAYWNYRAWQWKKLFMTTGLAEFKRFAEQYVTSMPLDRVLKNLDDEFLHRHLLCAVMVEMYLNSQKGK